MAREGDVGAGDDGDGVRDVEDVGLESSLII